MMSRRVGGDPLGTEHVAQGFVTTTLLMSPIDAPCGPLEDSVRSFCIATPRNGSADSVVADTPMCLEPSVRSDRESLIEVGSVSPTNMCLGPSVRSDREIVCDVLVGSPPCRGASVRSC